MHMYENTYTYLSDTIDSLKKTLTSLITLQTDTTQMCLSSLDESIKNIKNILSSSFYSSIPLDEVSKQVSNLCKIMLSNLTDIAPISEDTFDFLDEINFQNEYVEFTKDECDSINKLIETSESTNIPIVVPKKKYPSAGFIISVLSLILSLYATFGTTPFQKELLEGINNICNLLIEFQSDNPQSAPEPDLSIQESHSEAPDFYKM